MDFINNINLVTGRGCGVLNIVDEVAHLGHAIIGSTINFLNIDTVACCNFFAQTAGTAGVYGRSLFAIENPRQNPRHGGFSYTTCAGK